MTRLEEKSAAGVGGDDDDDDEDYGKPKGLLGLVW
jgi:hypothetical protein